jgi:acetolactate synthase-1/2/3 large subunit
MPFEGALDYVPGKVVRRSRTRRDSRRQPRRWSRRKNPAIYAGQGVHWAEAYDELRALAEHLAIPVMTQPAGQERVRRDAPARARLGRQRASTAACASGSTKCDLLFGIGCSFTATSFGLAIPAGKRVIHATLDPLDIDKSVPSEIALVGDAKLTLADLLEAVKRRVPEPRNAAAVTQQIVETERAWFAKWEAKCTQSGSPLSPYRVLWDMQQTVDVANTIITHDAGSPRDQLVPFWKSTSPARLHRLGQVDPTRLRARPGDGGQAGPPRQAVHQRMGRRGDRLHRDRPRDRRARAHPDPVDSAQQRRRWRSSCRSMPVATDKYRATDISGDYAAFAPSLGCHRRAGHRSAEIVPRLRRAIAPPKRPGSRSLVEFIHRAGNAVPARLISVAW